MMVNELFQLLETGLLGALSPTQPLSYGQKNHSSGCLQTGGPEGRSTNNQTRAHTPSRVSREIGPCSLPRSWEYQEKHMGISDSMAPMS